MYKYDVHILERIERVQKRATKLIEGLRDMFYSGAGRFGAAVLARPFWRDRFGAGRFGAEPFWRRTFWRS